tara:strand:+ start:559 stop:807 length:249 start_codon:yes stop_codon:yes gene_type:complete
LGDRDVPRQSIKEGIQMYTFFKIWKWEFVLSFFYYDKEKNKNNILATYNNGGIFSYRVRTTMFGKDRVLVIWRFILHVSKTG